MQWQPGPRSDSSRPNGILSNHQTQFASPAFSIARLFKLGCEALGLARLQAQSDRLLSIPRGAGFRAGDAVDRGAAQFSILPLDAHLESASGAQALDASSLPDLGQRRQ